jgi:hypothetical protein
MSIETNLYVGLIAATEAARDTISTTLRISYPGVEFNPVNNETYLEIRHLKNTNINPAWDASKILQGFWQVSVIVNGAQIGDVTPTDFASAIADYFAKNKRIFIANGRSVKIHQSPTVLTSIVDIGKTIYPVSIPYHCLKMGDD